MATKYDQSSATRPVSIRSHTSAFQVHFKHTSSALEMSSVNPPNDSVCLVCIEQNDSVYLLCDHNGSFGAMATEYNDSVCLVCICDRYGSKRNGLVDLL